MPKATFFSQVLLAGIALSFVGAKGCLGGDVSLGNDHGAAAGKGGANEDLAAAAGTAPSTLSGSGGAPAATAAPPNPSEAPLSLGDDGLLSAPDFGVSGSLYAVSDGFGSNGASTSGDCERAGH